MKHRFTWKWVFLFGCALVFGGGLIVLLLSSHGLGQFNQIKHGATKEEVIRRIGRPAESFTNALVFLQFGGSEAWAYPKESILAEGANTILTGKGFGNRLFLPETNDYVVIFDSSGLVSKTLEPGEGR